MNMDEVIGSRIRNAREAAGLSQSGLSSALGVRGLQLPAQTIYKIEQGKRKVLASELPVFGSALGIPAANLLGLGEDRGPLLVAGSRLHEAGNNLQAAAIAYGRAMLSHAQAADGSELLHPSDERFVTESLIRQTPGWMATADVLASIESTLKLNRVTLEGRYSKSVLDALRAEHDHFHGASDG